MVPTLGLSLEQPETPVIEIEAQQGTLSVTPGGGPGSTTIDLVQPDTPVIEIEAQQGKLTVTTGNAIDIARIVGAKSAHSIQGRRDTRIIGEDGTDILLDLVSLRHHIEGSVKDTDIMKEKQHIRYVRGSDGDIPLTAIDLDTDTLDGSEVWRWVVRENPAKRILVDYTGSTRITIAAGTNLPTIVIDPADFNDVSDFPNTEQPKDYMARAMDDKRQPEATHVARGNFQVVTPVVHDLAVG